MPSLCAEADDALRQLIAGPVKSADSVRMHVEMKLDTAARLPAAERVY